MNKELFISSTPHETKVAVAEDDQLAEIYFERESEYTLAGSIYKGRVTRVLPGMQSAFVDIGLERDAFLYVTDFLEESEDQDEIDTIPMPPPREGRSQRDFARSAAEPRANGHDIQPHLIQPEEPAEFVEPEETDADASVEAEAAQGEGSDEEGTRRWRGRRRRGRGRRGRGSDRPNGKDEANGEAAPAGAAEEAAGEEPSENEPQQEAAEAHEPEAEAAAEPEEPREIREPREPREFRGRDRDRGRGGRDFGRESYGPPAGFQPIVLPGESLAKYGQRSENAEEETKPSGQPEPPAASPFSRRRPSTQVDDIMAVQEVRAKDRNRREEPRSEEAGIEAVAVAAPAVEAVKHGPGPEVLGDVSEHEPESKEESRFEQMNVAAAFGGGEAEPEELQTDTESRNEIGASEEPRYRADSETPEHSAPKFAVSEERAYPGDSRSLEGAASGLHEIREEEHQPEVVHEDVAELPEHGAPGGTMMAAHEAFAPGDGEVHEEEIVEEESDLPPQIAEAARVEGEHDEDFEELEEEVLDRIADDQHQSRVQQLAEAVDENHIEQVAIHGDEADAEPTEAEEIEYSTEAAGETAEGEEEGADEGVEEEEFTEEPIGENGGHAEMRGSSGTSNLQQRQERKDRPRFDRRQRGGRRGPRRGAPRHEHRTQLISELLKEGQEILVQIAKEPIGKKGARITSHIALPGRFLVYMPTVNHIGVSRKISSEEERQRLKRIVISERENGQGGFIVRTAADHAPEDELRADIRFLKNLWKEIRQRAETGKAPSLIYHDLNLVERILRDQVNENFTSIWVDTEQDYERMLRFVNRFQPALVKRVKLYTKETPLFEQFNIQDEINKALKSKVWLKSGGYIVINQTEALVAIDVNTGKYVGKTSRLEDTIVKTNVDAIKEIVRQVRLRDLGGIIVIDFIDMDERRNRQKVMQALEEALRSDRAPSKVLQFNDFGLVAITRKRVKQSLERTLGAPCNYCSGTGLVKSVSTMCNEIWVEMRKMAKHFDHSDIMLRVHPEVAKALKANGGRWIQEIEELTGKNLIVKSDPLLHQEQFDIN